MSGAPFFWLAVLAGISELFTVAFAARDSDVARRLRELNPATLATDADRGRNARWHGLGAVQRAAVALLLAIAVVGVARLPWWLVAPGWAVTGGWALRRFDYAFAVRFGLPKDYLGKTAALDVAGFGSRPMRWWGTGAALVGAAVWALLN